MTVPPRARTCRTTLSVPCAGKAAAITTARPASMTTGRSPRDTTKSSGIPCFRNVARSLAATAKSCSMIRNDIEAHQNVERSNRALVRETDCQHRPVLCEQARHGTRAAAESPLPQPDRPMQLPAAHRLLADVMDTGRTRGSVSGGSIWRTAGHRPLRGPIHGWAELMRAEATGLRSGPACASTVPMTSQTRLSSDRGIGVNGTRSGAAARGAGCRPPSTMPADCSAERGPGSK
ncbi:hypothetical protein SAMN05421837_12322 [Amycolatopsis pretoriensis]|uniref:Uncharacterized protein n=1 Tax=Amycolatopsis pretoriensis TaxID=218821 RepID=A0A1H5RJH2_9PSEU|nr:hypothetical protein SAMN05421837_12322 [Amycolatopsis pretoriensis]